MKHTSSPLRSLLGAIAFCCPVALPSSLYAADRMIPGQWEFTMITDGAQRVFTSCMSVDDAKQVNGNSDSGRAAAERKSGGRCTVKSFTVGGNSVEYTLVCGTRTINSMTVFHGDSSEGTLTTTVEGKATTSQITAHRVGACS